jgi:mono/diheme cytochrome c family protein
MVKRILITMLVCTVALLAQSQTKKPATKASTAISSASMKRGKAVYNTYCVACHQTDGGGVPNMNPTIVKTSYVLGPKSQLINIILKGMQGVDIDGESYSNVMPSHSFLTNQQIADVLTYVRSNFGNKASGVSVVEVAAVRNKK